MTDTDPFTTLGLSPTLDRDAIKRAYFEAVRRNPPHANPEAFRLVRSAYDTLSDGTSLQRAWLGAPLDEAHQLALWNQRFSARIDAACVGVKEERAVTHSVELLIDRCTRTRIR